MTPYIQICVIMRCVIKALPCNVYISQLPVTITLYWTVLKRRAIRKQNFQLVHLCPYTVLSLYNTMFGPIRKDHVRRESCSKGTILQRNYWKMAIACVIMRCVTKGLYCNVYISQVPVTITLYWTVLKEGHQKTKFVQFSFHECAPCQTRTNWKKSV